MFLSGGTLNHLPEACAVRAVRAVRAHADPQAAGSAERTQFFRCSFPGGSGEVVVHPGPVKRISRMRAKLAECAPPNPSRPRLRTRRAFLRRAFEA